MEYNVVKAIRIPTTFELVEGMDNVDVTNNCIYDGHAADCKLYQKCRYDFCRRKIRTIVTEYLSFWKYDKKIRYFYTVRYRRNSVGSFRDIYIWKYKVKDDKP
jgi:hypothetical protein